MVLQLLSPHLLLASLLSLPPAQEPARVLPELHDLESLAELRERFNETAGMPRVVLLLSPSCPACIGGGRLFQQYVMEWNPDAEIQVFAIWFRAIAKDRRSSWPPGLITDPRVEHYWDASAHVGKWFGERFTERPAGSPEWDAWFLFDAATVWSEESGMEPSHWGRTIYETRQLLLDSVAAALEQE